MKDAALHTSKAVEILSQRASALAKEEGKTLPIANSNLLLFYLNKQKFALAFQAIDKIIPVREIRTLPGINPAFSGLLYYDSDIWSVVNLGFLLGCPDNTESLNFILLEKKQHRFAFAIGDIAGQIAYDPANGLNQLDAQNSKESSFVEGVYQTEIAVLNVRKIIAALECLPLHAG